MSYGLIEQRVICPKCRFRQVVQVPSIEGWRVDAQCPSCENWHCFTLADTHEPPRCDAKLEAARQRLGAQLWEPINEHRSHPAVAWVNKVGNGLFKDDFSEPCWPVPCWVYRFLRGLDAAYIWHEESTWFARGWHPMRSRRTPPDPSEVTSFGAALDRLLE